jgi:hypothetical protein
VRPAGGRLANDTKETRMVDFGELKDKAQDFVGDHADQVKEGVDKAGDFVADKIGHEEQVEKVEGAISGFVDKIAGDENK